MARSTGNEVAPLWIGGEWVDTGEHRDSTNPATGEVIGSYVMGRAEDAERAIAAAKQAFRATPVLFGLPTEAAQRAARGGRLVLGGCFARGGGSDPQWQCSMDSRHRWTSGNPDSQLWLTSVEAAIGSPAGSTAAQWSRASAGRSLGL
jgi:Aldehyde dehydrogenase family